MVRMVPMCITQHRQWASHCEWYNIVKQVAFRSRTVGSRARVDFFCFLWLCVKYCLCICWNQLFQSRAVTFFFSPYSQSVLRKSVFLWLVSCWWDHSFKTHMWTWLHSTSWSNYALLTWTICSRKLSLFWRKPEKVLTPYVKEQPILAFQISITLKK